jgi:hypothetical protein
VKIAFHKLPSGTRFATPSLTFRKLLKHPNVSIKVVNPDWHRSGKTKPPLALVKPSSWTGFETPTNFLLKINNSNISV